ncbi:sensor histidine kinase [Glaciibacter psychrotolerans]|uniref:histidine kinase n=1 Tax=Glaciibacter psychrotolerans TaxID=670054 RepID=A0A7Z0ED34_9MICO|nr:histidine kinase [Leifsonia psychrotolerans]NYJ18955.1 signal transduction histidine kinase [Leifsonia psychrotolerans]
MTAAPPLPSDGWAVSTAPAGSYPPRSRSRRTWALTGSIALAVLCALLVMSAGGTHGGEHSTFPSAVQALAIVGVFPMLAVSVLLIWRHRFPLLISILATALTVALPTTPLPALVALAALTAARRGWVRWTMMGATYAATIVSFCWDVASETSHLATLSGGSAEGSAARLALFWVVPILAALAVAPFAAYGVTRQIRAERDTARRGNVTAARNIAALHQEVSIERERHEIARELHDTLAARLSSVSLHAGALELQVGDSDARATAAARAVRESAQHSLDDVRSVVRVLRNPELHTGAGAGLVDIPGLIDAAVREGTDVRTQMFVADASACSPSVAHAAYRIVQEAISNVRRHAPGASLSVDLRAGPETGVTIRIVNRLVPEAHPTSTGGGNGLVGMSERAALVGGSFEAGETAEGTFAVVAWLPWVGR